MTKYKIGILIPAHNEEELILSCINSLKKSIKNLNKFSNLYEVIVLVVLDSCKDNTKNIVEKANINYIECNSKAIGKTRDIGIRHLISLGCQWISCIDADSIADINWLQSQIDYINCSEIVFGDVYLPDGGKLLTTVRGCNIAFSAASYIESGGFPDVEYNEEIAIVLRYSRLHRQSIFNKNMKVITSDRLEGRVEFGFNSYLKDKEGSLE